MKRVTGLGGFFFKAKDRDTLMKWYRERLGIEAESWGTMFRWREPDNPDKTGYTVWSPFAGDTKYFDPSDSPFMVNYRVADLEALLDALKEEGVEIVGEMTREENGKFAWVLDPEGNKIELWEPVDSDDDPYL